jgi:hypothetical protein
MSQAVLASGASLIARLLMDTVPNTTAAANAAMQDATMWLSSVLRTPFDQVTGQVDVFHPRYSLGQPIDVSDTGPSRLVFGLAAQGAGKFVVLKLRYGLLASTPVVAWNTSFTDLVGAAGNQTPDATVVDTERGTVAIHDIDLTSMYVSVTYNAGLAKDVSNPPVYQNVPDWLVDAALSAGVVFLDQNYVAYRGDRAATPNDIRLRKGAVREQVQRYVRYVPNCEYPL